MIPPWTDRCRAHAFCTPCSPTLQRPCEAGSIDYTVRDVSTTGGRDMEFRLFGEVQLWVAGQPLDVGTPRQRAVLAALAVDAGRPVPIETLIDRVWGDDPPVEARNVLYSHLSRIRQLLKQAADMTGIEQPKVARRS